MKKIIREILNFRSEYFITVLFITLFICSLNVVGLSDLKCILFNFMLLLTIPSSFIGVRYSRRLIYEVWKEELKDED